MSDSAADRLAAGAPFPAERGVPLRPYISTTTDGYRVGFWHNSGKGPAEYFGPAFPLTRAGQRSAQELAAAIERRLDDA